MRTRIEYAPVGQQDITGPISVELKDDEEVHWNIFNGKVIGYTINKKAAEHGPLCFCVNCLGHEEILNKLGFPIENC